MSSLEGRIAIATGAASGIGRSTALAIARHGARLLVTDINASALADTVTMITGFDAIGMVTLARLAPWRRSRSSRWTVRHASTS